MRVVAYVRRSTNRQALSRAAQLRSIRDAAKARGWQIVRVETDTASGKRREGRAGLDAAMRACRKREADALVAARLDRLARSVPDFGALLEDARDRRYGVIVLDFDLDTTKANGRLVANIIASVASWEREIIGERTSEALAVKRERGCARQVADPTRARIRELHGSGLSERAIAEQLEQEGVPALGKRWHRTTVRRILKTAA